MKKFCVGKRYHSFNSVWKSDKVISKNPADYPVIVSIEGDMAVVETRIWGNVDRKIEVENGVEIIRNIDIIYGEKFYMRADKPKSSRGLSEYVFGWYQP